MKLKLLTMALAVILLSSSALAGTKKEIRLDATAAEVFKAALTVARLDSGVSKLSEQQMRFTFRTGANMETLGYVCDISVTSIDESHSLLRMDLKLKVRLQLKQHGEPDRISHRFFFKVKELLEKSRNTPNLANPQ